LSVKVPRIAEPKTLNLRKFDQGLKIKLRQLGVRAVEEFAPVLLPRAIQTVEEAFSEFVA
jgi:hypothetical protein